MDHFRIRKIYIYIFPYPVVYFLFYEEILTESQSIKYGIWIPLLVGLRKGVYISMFSSWDDPYGAQLENELKVIPLLLYITPFLRKAVAFWILFTLAAAKTCVAVDQ